MRVINIAGVELTLTEKQAEDLLTALNSPQVYDPKTWHYSESKGIWIKIKDMQTNHLLNSFKREYTKAVEKLFNDQRAGTINHRVMLQHLATLNDKYFAHSSALYAELYNRSVL